jgi:DTW domain-containing protein
MLEHICICEFIPQVESRVRWVFVQHDAERYKTTNTGILAQSSLVDSQMCWYRTREDPTEPPVELGEGRESWLLFPRSGADPLPAAELEKREGPITIVVPDGTWSQTRKIVRIVPALKELPCVALPPEAHARWSVRLETLGGGMSTIDAVCWMLAAMEGPEVAKPLEDVARIMWERTIVSRGAQKKAPQGT